MSQVILYLLTELTRKLRQLMLRSGAGEAVKPVLKRKADGNDVFDGTVEPAAKREAFGRSRTPTLVNVDGLGQCIAVLTSGGDAQGRDKNIVFMVLLKQ